MPRIRIDTVEYEIPMLDELTLDEGIIVEKYAGMGISELELREDIPLGAVKAVVVVAILRARPDVSEREAAALVGKLEILTLKDLWVRDSDEDDESPPLDPTSAPAGSLGASSSENASDESPDHSGASTNGASESSPESAAGPSHSGAPSSG
jgi:hypothetical protein